MIAEGHELDREPRDPQASLRRVSVGVALGASPHFAVLHEGL